MRQRNRPEETGPLPQFSLDPSDADRTLEWRGYRELAFDDLELVEEEPAETPSIAPVAFEETRIIERRPRALPWRRLVVPIVACVGFAALAVFARTPPSSTSALAASLAAPPAPAPVPVIAPPPPPPVAPAPPPPATGTIVTPLWAKGRRVWIDGKAIPGHAPKLEAGCGKHKVKVGTYGKTRSVDIPCGGEIKVAP